MLFLMIGGVVGGVVFGGVFCGVIGGVGLLGWVFCCCCSGGCGAAVVPCDLLGSGFGFWGMLVVNREGSFLGEFWVFGEGFGSGFRASCL